MQVERGAVAGRGFGHVGPVGLDAADARGALTGQQFHLVPHLGAAGNKGAGDHGTVSLESEYPVHGQTEQVAAAFGSQDRILFVNGVPQGVQPLARL